MYVGSLHFYGGYDTEGTLSLSNREPAMDRSDGWSKRRVDGSSVLRLSLNHVDNSVAPIESSPTDMSDTSADTDVPVSSVAVSISLLMKPSGELALCIQE